MAKIILDPGLVDRLLLGPKQGGRMVQDSPIRGDVLAAYAADPDLPRELLLTPYKSEGAAGVASTLAEEAQDDPNDARVSYLEGVVAANFTLKRMLYSALTMTRWWQDIRKAKVAARSLRAAIRKRVGLMIKESQGDSYTPTTLEKFDHPDSVEMRQAAALFTFLGVVMAASEFEGIEEDREITWKSVPDLTQHIAADEIARLIADAGHDLYVEIAEHCQESPATACNTSPSIFAISLNRPVELAVARSVSAIKGDSARSLFSIDCSKIAWAVLDSGIDRAHPAFRDHSNQGENRIRKTYDFTRMRLLISPSHKFNDARRDAAAKELAGNGASQTRIDEVSRDLKRFAEDASDGRQVDWGAIESYVELADPETPNNAHGTHVAGIIGADWRETADDGNGNQIDTAEVKLSGVCPDIKLYDFRVVGTGHADTEFNVIAAMQFIRWLNERNNFRVIHGANMSLSIKHSVRNYACGATPVCQEAERLVKSGVFVTAAAGNRGYQNFQLRGGEVFDNYAPSSITDPGNAEAVLTVGSTHRSSPHTYGVSFFSSRGPTGDGRAKPDLLAPGEKIVSAVPGEAEDTRDGTSMAAPHAAGAAALIMARNDEFVGKPEAIKRILIENCTDLGRERSFQGAGMIDVLRALQSI